MADGPCNFGCPIESRPLRLSWVTMLPMPYRTSLCFEPGGPAFSTILTRVPRSLRTLQGRVVTSSRPLALSLASSLSPFHSLEPSQPLRTYRTGNFSIAIGPAIHQAAFGRTAMHVAQLLDPLLFCRQATKNSLRFPVYFPQIPRTLNVTGEKPAKNSGTTIKK